MTRGGHRTERDVPERRCIVTGDVQPKAGLVRFVVGPDGQIVPDLADKLPGRGIWVTADRGLITKSGCEGIVRPSGEGAGDGAGCTGRSG